VVTLLKCTPIFEWYLAMSLASGSFPCKRDDIHAFKGHFQGREGRGGGRL